jgi:hypothetical protein
VLVSRLSGSEIGTSTAEIPQISFSIPDASTLVSGLPSSGSGVSTAEISQMLFLERDNFEGFTWEQAQHIVTSFISVANAKSKFTEKRGKLTLN